ncbi:MAG TPA: DUF4383 domain-containing protein [Candidatus Dormibacteraeota bacterium]|nr:DUF4383 domain-containing protein [Candidatus Dormibacteraeota bacterium]
MGLNRTVAAVLGVVYLAAGVAGFILDSPLFGLFDVNTLHNIVHLVFGAALLYGLMNTALATNINRTVGAILVVLGILGFVSADGFGLVPLGGYDIWLHLGSGIILLAISMMGSSEAAVA